MCKEFPFYLPVVIFLYYFRNTFVFFCAVKYVGSRPALALAAKGNCRDLSSLFCYMWGHCKP
uniref:Uncharacterized protein n=1 Tax=Anguilla anguilla TaxID=7936 RepID=A0A0E9PY03_ANGAN